MNNVLGRIRKEREIDILKQKVKVLTTPRSDGKGDSSNPEHMVWLKKYGTKKTKKEI